jgi:peptidoglycan/LPS O-acetylase OafA/YrhL
MVQGVVHGAVHGTVTVGRYLIVPLTSSLQKSSKSYRPEIDGLRAIAVLAVIANHLGSAVLPGGFLGVDIFFVISGYVVTSSLVARPESGWADLLRGFYRRRFKRLLPALILMVLVSALLFTLFVSPFDDSYRPSLRTAMAALFGVSNLYLLRQGTHYFSPDNHYNPWMHSWSLGVEEQYYLIWPLLLLACGFGRPAADRWRRRRLIQLSLALLGASLSLDLVLTLHRQPEQAFFLMPARFWELALGCLAYLLHRGHREARTLGAIEVGVGESASTDPQLSGQTNLQSTSHHRASNASSSYLRILLNKILNQQSPNQKAANQKTANQKTSNQKTLPQGGLVPWVTTLKGPLAMATLAGLLLLLTRPETERTWTSLAVTALTACLLILAQPRSIATQLLAQRWIVAIGLLSYSLYLWHWPLIVLTRWTIGLRPAVIVPLLLLIGLAALLSYRLELFCRYGPGLPWVNRQALLGYPTFSLFSAALLVALQGPLQTRLYGGRLDGDAGQSSTIKRIGGTSIDTIHCFVEPTTPIPNSERWEACRSHQGNGGPTLFFEGDSHTHALIPLGESLLRSGHFNVAFVARGGCPFPYFQPWQQQRQSSDRYRLCQPHAQARLADLERVVQPGDRLVLVSNLPSYLGEGTRSESPQQFEAYAGSILKLANQMKRQGVKLVLVSPLPSFGQSKITLPLSLCHSEWFRPNWAIPPICKGVGESRQVELKRTETIRNLQKHLANISSAIDVFDPFDSICPPSKVTCRTYDQGKLLFADGNHLTQQGALLLYPAFARSLSQAKQAPRAGGTPMGHHE